MISSEQGLTVSEQWLEFDSGDRDRVVTIADETDHVDLVIEPPRAEIRSGLVGQPAPWRSTIEAHTPDQLGEDRFVAVRAPGAVSVQFAFLTSTGEVTQTEAQPRRKPGDVHEVVTRRFVDTARSAVTGRIVARIINSEGKQVDVTVVSVQPPKLCSGAHLAGVALEFRNLLAVDDLAVTVWRAAAPWLAPQVVPIADGRAALPAELVEAGPLVCEVFIDDPWTSVEPPQQPGGSAFRVEQSGWVGGNDEALTALSQFLAGEGEAPAAAGAMPEVWAALCFPYVDETNRRRVYAALTQLLRREPRAALEALGNSTIALEDKMALLIRTELVNCSFAADFTLNELHADPWFGCMVELSDLPMLYRNRGVKRAERAETLAYLKDKGGEQLIESLQDGDFGFVRAGSFGRTVMTMDSLPVEQIDGILDGLRLVPGALLEEDSRTAASVEAYRHRTEWVASEWTDNFAVQLATVLTPIRRACPLAYQVIGVRSAMLDGLDLTDVSWMYMTLQSLTQAVLARLEAHSRIGGQYLNSGLLATWTRLAELAPGLVATDLLIAEALIVHHCHGDLIGDRA